MHVANTKHCAFGLRRILAAASVALVDRLAVRRWRRPSALTPAMTSTKTRSIPSSCAIFCSGLGLKREGDDPGIDYHERSPLVVPPTRDLPPPDTGIAATKNPAWPKDPDVKRAKAVKRAVKNTVAAEARRHASAASRRTARNWTARPDRCREYRRAAGRCASRTIDAEPAWARRIQPAENVDMEEHVRSRRHGQFRSWQSRRAPALTDPPPGLRTPSPKYQYGNKNTLEPTADNSPDAPVGVTVSRNRCECSALA